ncbi:DNA-binding response regulator [Rossellomorea sp. BNER]|uniref:DNA-binding response regulator n=1 Tax=Rossellomorea sp. BNER TaxID=2962031 RepID=UPI003AF28C24|nr:DNA-binding response regulator [Rossellomorea sp. BNER]
MSKMNLERIIKDYHWMMNSIKIMRESLEDAGEGITAQYGVISTMPKAKGTLGDPIYKEVLRREKRRNKLQEYIEKVLVIQERIHVITDEREIEVLHWLLEGKSYRWIGMHMGLSHSHIRRLKDSIVYQLENNVPNVPKDTILPKEELSV